MFRPQLETLERRMLPSATPAVVQVAPPIVQATAPRVQMPALFPFVDARNRFEGQRGLYSFDRRGVLVMNLAPLGGSGYAYHPHAIARYLIALSANYGHRPTVETRAAIARHAAWLVSHMTLRSDGLGHNFSVIPYRFGYTYAGYGYVPPGWTSGLAAAYQVVGLYMAAKALNSPFLARKAHELTYAFDIPYTRGGFLVTLPGRGPRASWYEEYVSRSLPRAPLVLNGHLYTLAALGWYYRQTGNQRIHRLYIEGLRGLARALPAFDDNGFSTYDQLTRRHNQSYHNAHVYVLRYFYYETGVAPFRRYARLWAHRIA